MKKPELPSFRHTVHQIAVGTAATVVGTVIAMLIMQLVNTNQVPGNDTKQPKSPEIVQ
ncbi:MAG: hypothetical protein AB8B63_12410 [Granulosicoccus sp.]